MAGPRLELGRREALARVYAALGPDPEARLRKILRIFYARMSEDVMIGFFFAGRDTDAIADRQALLLLKAMGAREEYTGKLPGQAHGALPPILPGHFDRRLRILDEVLAAEGLSAEDRATWIGFESAFRDVIVST